MGRLTASGRRLREVDVERSAHDRREIDGSGGIEIEGASLPAAVMAMVER